MDEMPMRISPMRTPDSAPPKKPLQDFPSPKILFPLQDFPKEEPEPREHYDDDSDDIHGYTCLWNDGLDVYSLPLRRFVL